MTEQELADEEAKINSLGDNEENILEAEHVENEKPEKSGLTTFLDAFVDAAGELDKQLSARGRPFAGAGVKTLATGVSHLVNAYSDSQASKQTKDN